MAPLVNASAPMVLSSKSSFLSNRLRNSAISFLKVLISSLAICYPLTSGTLPGARRPSLNAKRSSLIRPAVHSGHRASAATMPSTLLRRYAWGKK